MLHAPGECIYCDDYPDLQQARVDYGVNFTGYAEPGLLSDPLILERDLDVVYAWEGNAPKDPKQVAMDNLLENEEL